MQPEYKEFSEYFMQELNCLRSEAAEFGREFPGVARELQLSAGKSSDPHIELLMQSFAYMSARLHKRVDNEINEIPDAMLNTLNPGCAAPIPSMSIAHITVQPNGANYVNGYRLDKGRLFYAHAETEDGKTVKCNFTTCYETDLVPFQIISAEWIPVNLADYLKDRVDVHSVLRIKIKNEGASPMHEYKSKTLRFFIGNDLSSAHKLYELLCYHCNEITVSGDFKNGFMHLNDNPLSFIGYEDSHAVIPSNISTHQAYRMLQEYFFFPEKFLFFEINDIPLVMSDTNLTIDFLLNTLPEKNVPVNSSIVRLNCIPVINCFEQVTDPIKLDHYNYEYRMVADQDYHRYKEIHTILSMDAVSNKGAPKPIASYFSFDQYTNDSSTNYFWVARRKPSITKELCGTETYVSFHDSEFNLKVPAEELIIAKALCTNRGLAENMQSGSILILEGPGPVESCELIVKPGRYKLPLSSGCKSWRLISNLTLNHLSLNDGVMVLKNILSQYADDNSVIHKRQIDSITDISCKRIQKRIGNEAWRGFCNGMEVCITIDETVFDGGSILLFGTILRHFLALYANVNSFTQLKLQSRQKGLVHSWSPVAGEQELI